MHLLKSATKVVLLWFSLILGLLTSYAVVIGVSRGTMEPKEILNLFGYVTTAIVSFYFGKSQGENNTTQTVDNKLPELG